MEKCCQENGTCLRVGCGVGWRRIGMDVITNSSGKSERDEMLWSKMHGLINKLLRLGPWCR